MDSHVLVMWGAAVAAQGEKNGGRGKGTAH